MHRTTFSRLSWPIDVEEQPTSDEGERQGDFLGGKYLLGDCLGIGGMGEVYRATNVSLGRQVAIKVLNKEHTSNEDDVLRFLREARAVAAVHHPNVVDVFDVGRDDDGTPFIVQELLSGEDLESHLNATRDGRLSVAEAVGIMIPVAEGVAAAHARNVVHRDLKPANIFLARHGGNIVPKVLDFGACLYQTMGELSTTEQRMLIGTPHYMAPEQITAATGVDGRADVWAMGIILYEMLVGETPFENEDPNVVLKLVRGRRISPLRDVVPDAPERLAELVRRCLERDRERRLATATAMREELLRIQEELTTRARTLAVTLPDLDVVAPRRGPTPRGQSTRRGASLLHLLTSDDDVLVNEHPVSSGRPVRTAADVIRDAEEASYSRSSVPPAPDGGRESAPRGFGLAFESQDGGPLELDLETALDSAPASPDRRAHPSSMPPILRPRPATRSMEPAVNEPVERHSAAPPSRLSLAPPSRQSGAGARPIAPPRPLAASAQWTRSARCSFGAAIVVPALIAFIAVRQIPLLTAPLGHAMRGDSPLASGVLAVLALVGAAILAPKALGELRSGAVIVATLSLVLLGIVMIIVTFSASESALLESPPAAAGLVPLIAPMAPLALGFLAFRRAQAVWLSRYERREALLFVAATSALLYAALEVGPLGAVRRAAPDAYAGSALTVSAP